jgi:predicted acyltransferase (DUF342 family)
MSLPNDFNPATFLYLNPELQAFSNITSIEQARDFYLNNPSSSNLMYSFSNIPDVFDSRIFISDNKDGLAISDINQIIKSAMSNDGYTKNDLDVFSQYLPTVYKDAVLLSPNVLSFADLDYTITPNNLVEGDDIQILINDLNNIYSKVVSIGANTFTVSNYYYNNLSNVDIGYKVIGHRIYDVERLARINWVRNYRSSNPVFGDFSNRFMGLDPNFNVDLYKLLYQDARGMTNEQCILDYTSRRNNNDVRIGKSDEFVKSIDYVYTDVRNLHVSCNLKVDKNLILGGYWVDGITNNSTRNSVSACNTLLITETASKGYLDMYMNTTMTLCNMIVTNSSVLSNTVNTYGESYFHNKVSFSNEVWGQYNFNLLSNLDVFNDVNIANNIMLSNDAFVGRNATVSNDLFVKGDLQLSGMFILEGDCEILGTTTIHNVVDLGSNLTLSNDLLCKGNTFIVGDINVGDNVGVSNDIIVKRDAYVYNNVYINSNISLSNDLNVMGVGKLFTNVFVGSNVSLSNNLYVNGSGYVQGDLSVESNINVKELRVANDVAISNNLIVTSNSYLIGPVTCSNISTFENSMYALSNLYVDGTTSLSNSTCIFGGFTLCNTADITGSVNIGTDSTWGSLIVDIKGGVRADDYLLSSDVRVKNNITSLNIDTCLNFIETTPLISYNLKYDAKQRLRYGFMAHKIEEFDKNITKNVVDYIPTIAKNLVVNDRKLKFINHGLVAGDMVKLMTPNKETDVVSIIKVTQNTFTINTDIYNNQNVYVYGKQIPDFKAIDYTQLFAMSVGAIQKLIERVGTLEEKLESFSSHHTELT